MSSFRPYNQTCVLLVARVSWGHFALYIVRVSSAFTDLTVVPTGAPLGLTLQFEDAVFLEKSFGSAAVVVRLSIALSLSLFRPFSLLLAQPLRASLLVNTAGPPCASHFIALLLSHFRIRQ